MSLQFSVRSLCQRAATAVGVISAGETLSAGDAALALSLAQEMIDSWNTQPLTVVVTNRTVYPMVSGKGDPSNPYTIGAGGNFDTGSTERPIAIRNAGLLLNSSSPPVEIPLALITDDGFAALAVKTLSSSLPTQLYYNPTYPLGQIVLYPVPNTAVNSLVLYTDLLPSQMVTLNDVYICPTGSASALRLGLAKRMITSFAVPADIAARVTAEADQALSDFKAINVKMADLSLDLAFTQPGHGTYNILSDTGA